MKYTLEYIVIKGFLGFISGLSGAGRLKWGRRLGRIWYRVDRKHRSLAISNISQALGLSHEEAALIARRNFEHIGLNVTEFAAFGRIGELSRLVAVDGLENLTGALEKGRGAFLISGHIGNWELTGAVLSQKVPMTVVARPMKNPRGEQLVQRLRRQGGMKVLGHRNSTRPIISRLREGETITVLLDQNTGRQEAVFVPFFGRPASVNFGPALLAARTGAPVIPGFSIREDSLRHRALIGEEIELYRSSDRQEETGVNTARFTAAIESHIRRYPEQWFWVHNRWKNQPRPGERIYEA